MSDYPCRSFADAGVMGEDIPVILSVDDNFCREVAAHQPITRPLDASVTADRLLDLFQAQVQARHLDFAARWLRSQDQGFYTIGSAGHESNAAVALALRATDPALLHYRSGGFYAARSGQVDGSSGVRDVLLSLACAVGDPISGGRHKVFGHPGLAIIPQTSTISSHLPRALGLAFGLDRRDNDASYENRWDTSNDHRWDTGNEHRWDTSNDHGWPADAVVVCSFGDASANHSTAVGALNAAGYLDHRGVRLPLLFVCEDNGIGISTRTPVGWLERSLPAHGLQYRRIEGTDPVGCLTGAAELAGWVRTRRRPAVLHLKTVRFMGHAGTDAELGYRSRGDILADYARDPLLATARLLIDTAVATREQVLERYEQVRKQVMTEAATMSTVRRLETAAAVMEPLTFTAGSAVARTARRSAGDPVPAQRLTLAQSINTTLADVLATHPQALVFGEDVAVKGGVYGLTRGLRRRFGNRRVFDTLLDEQTILGTALGTALAGFLPIPEIQYLAYLHNAEDQLRGEAASLGFFSAGQYRNGMVVRIAGLAYQKGFGGHFHNDNSVAVLRDIPGLVLAVPAHPADAPGLLRTCVGLALAEGRVCVYLEPIARYHTRDLHAPGDDGWTASYSPAAQWDPEVDGLGSTRRHGTGRDVLIVTFGNGVFMSLRAAATLQQRGVTTSVLDLRWLNPLPQAELLRVAADFDRVLVVDETRHSGGVGEAVLAALVEGGYRGRMARVASRDSFIPLGPASDLVLLSEGDVLAGVQRLLAEVD